MHLPILWNIYTLMYINPQTLRLESQRRKTSLTGHALSRCYCWWTKSCTNKDDDYPIISRVLTIPGGCLGFCPSTVCWWICQSMIFSWFTIRWTPFSSGGQSIIGLEKHSDSQAFIRAENFGNSGYKISQGVKATTFSGVPTNSMKSN